jgi:glycosyltransferase involved in cell wall biosynthesis
MSNNIISIIIPTFNQGKYIHRCLTSISNQTIKNYEIIIIDKYSTDETKSIIEKFSYLPIKFFQIENGGIIANSRNYGIKKSSGNLIAFLDSDDYWTNNKLEICYKKVLEGYDLVFHNLRVISDTNKFFRKILKGRLLKQPIIKDLLLNGNPICNSSVIVKKEVLENVKLINESKKIIASEDYNLWLKISKITSKFCFLNKDLGFYQLDSNSISNRKNMSYPTLYAVKEFFPILNRKEKNKVLARIFYIGGRFFFKKKKNNYCKNKFLIALKFGDIRIKIKSLFFLIMIFLRI